MPPTFEASDWKAGGACAHCDSWGDRQDRLPGARPALADDLEVVALVRDPTKLAAHPKLIVSRGDVGETGRQFVPPLMVPER